MHVAQDQLWRDLEAFVFDEPGHPFPFSRRLARENGWTAKFTSRAIGEYRRFLYLAMVADHQVTPSEAVDQVWHLHLTYSRSYWKRLCADLLQRPLHHEPTGGRDQDGPRFRQLYAETLKSYEGVFGAPPEDIWPSPDERFRGGTQQWIDRAAYWVIPKLRVRQGVKVGLMSSGLALVLAACIELDPGKWSVSEWFLLLVVIVGLIAALVGHKDSGSCSTGCSGCGGD